MSEGTSIRSTEVPCPNCGYDLRATVNRRCPECGTELRGRVVSSRIPWVHRRYRGRVKSYLATLWMVALRPGLLAKEIQWPMSERHARRFYWVSVVLATLAGTLVMGAVLRMGGNSSTWMLDRWVLIRFDDRAFGISPAIVLADRWWVFIPLALGLLSAIRLGLFMYGLVLRAGTRGGFAGRRTVRLARYASALAMPVVTLIGLASLTGTLMNWDRFPRWNATLLWSSRGLALAAWLLLVIPMTSLAVRSGRLKVIRGMFLALVFPPLVAALGLAVMLVVLWIVGYVVIAWRSMSL